jgi:hypothetical protein
VKWFATADEALAVADRFDLPKGYRLYIRISDEPGASVIAVNDAQDELHEMA